MIVGYYESWGIYSPNVHVRDLPLSRLTHLIYQNARVTEKGEVLVGDIYADIQHIYPDDDLSLQDYAGNFDELNDVRPLFPKLNTLISLGGYVYSNHFAQLCSSEQGRRKLAESAVQFMARYQFDGIDFQWFFVRDNNPEIQRKNEEGFISCLQTLRQRLNSLADIDGKQYWLSTTLYPSMNVTSEQAVLMANVLDFVSPTAQVVNHTHVPATRHFSPLYSDDGASVDGFVSRLISVGFPREKVILDVAPHAIAWQGVKNTNGLGQGFSGLSWGSWDTEEIGATGVYSRDYLISLLSNPDYQEYWDDVSKASYLYNPNKLGGHFVSFESRASLNEKVDYVVQQQLGGMGIGRLHADGDDSYSVVHYIFNRFYPLQNIKFVLISSYTKHQSAFLVSVVVFLVFVFFLVLMDVKRRKKRSRIAEEKQTFLLLQSGLSRMDWALNQSYQLLLGSELRKALYVRGGYLAYDQMIQGMMRPVHILLEHTRLAERERSVLWQMLNLNDSVRQLCYLVKSRYGLEVHADMNEASNVVIYSDAVYLQQFLEKLILLCCQDVQCPLTISIAGEETAFHQLDISCLDSDLRELSINHISDYRDLSKLASKLNIRVTKLSTPGGLFRLFLPAAQDICLPLIVDNQDENNEVDKVESIGVKDSVLTDSQQYMSSLQSFFESDLVVSDLPKFIEQIGQFFLVKTSKPICLTVAQGEQVVSVYGATSIQQQDLRRYQYDLLQFEVRSETNLTDVDEQFFSILFGHIQLIHKSIKELVKKPAQLSELYEIASNKDKIEYIQADKGYSFIYLSDRKEPKCISMRLRVIKQYFDDDELLRIHRSYLVNPKRVVSARKANLKRFELILDARSLPVGRSYIDLLQQRYNYWFL